MGYYKKIHIKDLILWESNPRISHDGTVFSDEKEAVSQYFKKNESQMRQLTLDIAKNGLSPHDLVVVLPINDVKFKVFEGNRRVSAIKSLSRPYYLDYNMPLRNHIQRLSSSYEIKKNVYCYVADNVEQAHSIVEKTHAGINKGIGRVPWGTLEKDAFKIMTNKEDTTLSYKLMQQYPDTFDDIILELKSTNIDRVLTKKLVRDLIETDANYSGLDTIQQTLVLDILEEVKRITSASDRSIAYIFHNNDDVKRLLESFIKQRKDNLNAAAVKINEVAKARTIPLNINIKQSIIYIESGDTYSLLDNIELSSEMDLHLFTVKSLGDKSALINENYIFEATNRPGVYNIQYIYPYKETTISKVCQVSVASKQMSVNVKEVQFFDAAFPFTIDISRPINDLIAQLLILDIRKYNLVATGCLRSLVEISIRVFNDKYDLQQQDSLEKQIAQFKRFLSPKKNLREQVIANCPMSLEEVTSFIGSIDPITLAKKLNLVTHVPGAYLGREGLFEISNNIISYILIIITILIK